MSDNNNSSLNNLFGHFINVEGISQHEYSFDNVNNMVCIDTSTNRIGINTLDPTCSLDISGTTGKINVNSISCENLDVSKINVYNNIDISGILDMSSNKAKLHIVNIDSSNNLEKFGLYYDNSGFVKIILPHERD